MSTKLEIGRRIKSARSKLGLTLRQVSEKVPGLNEQRLGNYESGYRTPGIDMVKQLARVLGVRASYLLTLDDEPGDERESALIKVFRHTDERGKDAITRAAESQRPYGTGAEEEDPIAIIGKNTK